MKSVAIATLFTLDSRLTLPDRQFRSCLETTATIATNTTSLHAVLIQFRLGVTPLQTQLIRP
jgi:hypothetical protein